jgi:3-hydroxyisobutyrate dehydrogenase-like beta-hydroxyacid dehydrogenase
MGLAMATNIQTHLKNKGMPALRYTNRTMARGAPLKEMGAVACETVGELMACVDVVWISVCVVNCYVNAMI